MERDEGMKWKNVQKDKGEGVTLDERGKEEGKKGGRREWPQDKQEVEEIYERKMGCKQEYERNAENIGINDYPPSNLTDTVSNNH